MVITIIVLIILTTCVVMLAGGENGIIAKAQQAVEAHNVATAQEKVLLEMSSLKIELAITGQTVSQYLYDTTNGSDRRAALAQKGIEVPATLATGATQLVFTVDGYDVTTDLKGNIKSTAEQEPEVNVPVESITINVVSSPNQSGGTFSATVLPANATNKTVNWTISGGNTSVQITPAQTLSGENMVASWNTTPVTITATATDGSGITDDYTYYLQCCVPYYTDITVGLNGETKKVTELKAGDDILTYSDFGNKEQKVGRIENIKKLYRDHTIKMTLIDGTYFEVTNDHPIYTDEGWAAYDPTFENYADVDKIQLKVGQKALNENNELKEIVNIERIEHSEGIEVYAITVEDGYPCFFAKGYLVHNSPCQF